MTETASKLVTAEELLAMGDIGRCELLYGEIFMMSPAGGAHGFVAMRLGSLIDRFVADRDLGLAFAAETGFVISRDPDVVRAPDASFIVKAHVRGRVSASFIEGVPDLAVEVVSPNDTKREVEEKVNMWLAHGTAAVWVADPKRKTVEIHRVGQPTVLLGSQDEIRDEPLLPGFVLPLQEVFRLP